MASQIKVTFVKNNLLSNKYYLLLILIFIGSFFVDISMGVLKSLGIQEEGGVGSLGQLWRTMLIALMFLLLKKDKKYYTLLLVMFFIITEVLSGIFHQNAIGIIVGVSQGIKVVYLVLLIFLMTHFIKENGRNGLKSLINIMILYELLISLMLYVSFFGGIGFSSYGQSTDLGTTGFFTGANALGFTLGTLTVLHSILLNERFIQPSFRNVFIFVFIVSSLLFIGTKVSIIYFIIAFYLFNFKLFLTCTLSVFILFIFFVDFSSIDLKQFSTVISRVIGNPEILPSLMGSRVRDIIEAFLLLNVEDNIFRFLIGGGGFLSYQTINTAPVYDILEADFFDVLFMYGLHGIISYCVFYIALAYNSLKIKRVFPFVIFIFINSAVAGHVIFNGQSAAALALVFVLISYLSKQKTRVVYEKN
ncbi:O-antigen ligase family protein [Shewanella benthica]|uniref:Uncharacterized protein n=1 Tax=Shewanella benthica KT99 TaxID=314608 RepID=A9D4I8_9GAMM|nr:O-antigen ligase family protein [Shewanella benthica]EDQ01564.1 hypothetical protein KT99_15460 [Shewanella benthica KT99]